MADLYVLLKRGLYWKPNGDGYTGVLSRAGRYSEEAAQARSRPGEDGVTMQLASEAAEFSPACWDETKIKVLLEQRADLRRRVERLEAAVRPFADMAGPVDPHRETWAKPEAYAFRFLPSAQAVTYGDFYRAHAALTDTD